MWCDAFVSDVEIAWRVISNGLGEDFGGGGELILGYAIVEAERSSIESLYHHQLLQLQKRLLTKD